MNKQSMNNQEAVQTEQMSFEQLLPALHEALSLLDDVYLAAEENLKSEVFQIWKSPMDHVLSTMSDMFGQIDLAQQEAAQTAAATTAFALGMYVSENFGKDEDGMILNDLIDFIKIGAQKG